MSALPVVITASVAASRLGPGRQNRLKQVQQRGFSLIELISVIVIMAIISLVALPRFSGVNVFASRGFHEQALAATRYAHRLAIASGCSIEVSFRAASGSLTLSRWTGASDCGVRTAPKVPVAEPGSSSAFVLSAPDGVTLSNDLLFYYDRIGRPHDNAGAAITSPAALRVDIDARRIQVTPETGLVVEN